MVNSKQSRISGAALLMAAQAIVLVLGYVTHLWIGRELGPSAYGIYGIILSVQSIVGLLLTLGVPVAVARFVSRDEEAAQSILRDALRIQSGAAFLVASTMFFISPLLAHVLRDASLVPYLRFVSLVVFLQAYYPVYTQYLSGMHLFTKQALLTALYAIAKLAGALALLTLLHIYGAFAGFAVGGLIAGCVGWWWTRRTGGKKKKALPYKAFLQFAGTYVLILVGLQILISIDLFMVKAILKDNEQAGYYNAAVTLSRISYLLLQALSFVILPSVSALTKPGASHDQAAEFIADSIRYLIALIVPSVALAAATSRALLALFFSGATYAPAAPILTILMVGLGSIAFFQLLTSIVAGAGKARVGLFLTIALIVLSVALGSVLIPLYGLRGAAWQTTIAGLTGLVILGAYTFRVFRIPFPLRSTINIIVAAATALIPTYVIVPHAFTLPLFYLAACIIYICMLGVLGEIRPVDRIRLANAHPALKFLNPSAKSDA